MYKMARQIAIGDIHGCLNTFKALLDKIQLSTSDELILLGDYIDRGGHSKGVIDYIKHLQTSDYTVTTLRGNHEQMLINDYTDTVQKGYKKLGDDRFLENFGISSLKELPIEYVDFCKNLPFYQQRGKYILVHAGLNFDYDDPFSQKEDLMWIRNWYPKINKKWLGNRCIIHGHTPLSRMEIMAQHRNLKKNQVLNIDGGAFLTKYKHKGFGSLCAFDMTNDKLYLQENIEKNNIY